MGVDVGSLAAVAIVHMTVSSKRQGTLIVAVERLVRGYASATVARGSEHVKM